jgi:hypothetical protein
MKILVLGDCQSNGNNCLSDRILGDSMPRSWSLRYHGESKKVLRWVLEQRHDSDMTLPLPLDDLEDFAWRYMRKQELAVAWPNRLPGAVTNLSFNGAHFLGHYHRLRNYLVQDRPDHVIVTDYKSNHIGMVFNFDNQQYVFEGGNYTDSHYRAEYPRSVHEQRLERLAVHKSQSANWIMRKHRRSYQALIGLLDKNQIPYSIMRFGHIDDAPLQAWDKFMPNHIDCTQIFRQYTVAEGEYGQKKLEYQQIIADLVQQHLDTNQISKYNKFFNNKEIP